MRVEPRSTTASCEPPAAVRDGRAVPAAAVGRNCYRGRRPVPQDSGAPRGGTAEGTNWTMGSPRAQAENRQRRGVASPRVVRLRPRLWPSLAATLLLALGLATSADAQQREFYGVNIQSPSGAGLTVEDDFNRMRDGNVGLLRFQISWRTVETQPGHFSWAGPDRIIGLAASRGIRTLPFIHGEPPEWVGHPPVRPRDRRAFARLMTAAARQYGPGGEYWRERYRPVFGDDATAMPVRAWQLLNEQNGRFHWGARPRPVAYGRLVRLGARAVRRVNPRAEIVLGGMFAKPRGVGSMTSWRFLSRLYRVRGIRRAFDTVGLNPYGGTLRVVSSHMRRIRRVMRRNNHRAGSIRATEVGWGSEQGGHALLKGPEGQAQMLRRMFQLMKRQRHQRRWKVRGVNWFSWQDGTAGCVYCSSSGLFAGPPNDRHPKPSWGAFQLVAR
jgi:hypothetical protein